MVLVSQLGEYFIDLKDERFISALALVHQRSPPTPSRHGVSRTPTASSRTTARSTRCAGI